MPSEHVSKECWRDFETDVSLQPYLGDLKLLYLMYELGISSSGVVRHGNRFWIDIWW